MIGTLRKEFAYLPLKTWDTGRWVWLREVWTTERLVEITTDPLTMLHFTVSTFEHMGNAMKAKRVFEDARNGYSDFISEV